MIKKQIRYLISSYAVVVFFLIFFSIGCMVKTPNLLTIAHEPLNPIGNKRDGKILIKKFVSKAEPIQQTSVLVIGSEEEKKRQEKNREKSMESERTSLGMLITSFFAEALEEAGYKVLFQEEQYTTSQNQGKFDAIIAGEIWGFNIEETALHLYSKLWVKVEALDPVNQKVLWRKQLIGEEKNVAHATSVAPEGEYNRVIRQAATKALNQAVTEFASDAFYKAIKQRSK